MIIAVDFDGTCVKHEYPLVGPDVPRCVNVLRDLVAQQHALVLFTMRHGKPLEDAQAWFAKHEIPLFGVNVNPDQKRWTQSPKAYAHLYIDDAALGCPLVHDSTGKDRPYVDWDEVFDELMRKGILKY